MDDLDNRFVAACAAGDTDLINQLADELDALDEADRLKPSATLHQAALFYAEQGLRVFRLSPRSKIPFRGSRGCLDATTDADQINAWWTDTPHANIGIATGHLIDVVDIDGPIGQASRAAHWDDIFATIDADAIAKVLTPRAGGMHVWVPVTGEGNSTNIVPGVDVRGAGGYVCVPPSVNDEGSYRFLGTPNLSRLVAA